MKCRKEIVLTGYRVQYVDLREPRHLRKVCEEVYPIDKPGLESLNMMGVNVLDFIESRYSRAGYHVVGVERITPKRSATLDLRDLWAAAEPPATEAQAGEEVQSND